jgi:hypothetical protein
LKALLCGISLLSGDHLDETKATRLLSMGVQHDLALLDITVFLEQTGNFLFGEARVNTSDKEVGSRVDGTIVLRSTAVSLGRATGNVRNR